MSGMDLVEFLTARLDEAEQVAKLLSGRRWYAYDDGHVAESVPGETWALGGDILPNRHSSYWPMFDPARVLADVAAKRRIVELHTGDHECSTYDHNGEIDNCTWVIGDCSTLKLLALPDADDEDYRQEWRP